MMSGNGPAALIVDDDPAVRDILAAVLRRDGWTADAVADGEEALHRLANRTYAVVVLDLLMPRMSGRDVIAAMRKMELTTPVIVISALSSDEALGLDPDIVTVKMRKPIELGDLRTVVKVIKQAQKK